MKDGLMDLALKWGVPLAIGVLLPRAMTHLKQLFGWIGTQPAAIQRIIVGVLALLGNVATVALGVELGADPMLWTDVEMQALLSAALGAAFHAATKASKAAKLPRTPRKRVNRAVAAAAARDMAADDENPFKIDGPSEDQTRIESVRVKLANGEELT